MASNHNVPCLRHVYAGKALRALLSSEVRPSLSRHHAEVYWMAPSVRLYVLPVLVHNSRMEGHRNSKLAEISFLRQILLFSFRYLDFIAQNCIVNEKSRHCCSLPVGKLNYKGRMSRSVSQVGKLSFTSRNVQILSHSGVASSHYRTRQKSSLLKNFDNFTARRYA